MNAWHAQGQVHSHASSTKLRRQKGRSPDYSRPERTLPFGRPLRQLSAHVALARYPEWSIGTPSRMLSTVEYWTSSGFVPPAIEDTRH